jgi:hypothetical protein
MDRQERERLQLLAQENKGRFDGTLTKADMQAGMSEAGSWTQATLAGWGVSWPPEKGWRRRLLRDRDPGKYKNCKGCGTQISGHNLIYERTPLDGRTPTTRVQARTGLVWRAMCRRCAPVELLVAEERWSGRGRVS